jgi:hypothetical protein
LLAWKLARVIAGLDRIARHRQSPILSELIDRLRKAPFQSHESSLMSDDETRFRDMDLDNVMYGLFERMAYFLAPPSHIRVFPRNLVSTGGGVFRV